ncbi:MAG: hypothetical protein ACKVJU_20910 [Verrucomicrobiales bacterium]
MLSIYHARVKREILSFCVKNDELLRLHQIREGNCAKKKKGDGNKDSKEDTHGRRF